MIQNNGVFKAYYNLKISQGKGHCVRKLFRIIFHLLKTGRQFYPQLLR